MKSSAVLPATPAFPKDAPAEAPACRRSAHVREHSFAHVMKEAEAGASKGHRNPRTGSSAGAPDPDNDARTRSEVDARTRSARSSCAKPASARRPGRQTESANPNPQSAVDQTSHPSSDPGASPATTVPIEAGTSDLAPLKPQKTQIESDESASAEATVASATNIIILPLPTNIVPFPALASTGAELGPLTVVPEGALGNGTHGPYDVTEVTEAVPGMPATVRTGRTAAPGDVYGSVEGESRAASGVDPQALALDPMPDRERLTLQLRHAIARLDEIELESAVPEPLEDDVHSRIVAFPGAPSDAGNKVIPVAFGDRPPMAAFADPSIANIDHPDLPSGDTDDHGTTGTPVPAGRLVEEKSAGSTPGSNPSAIGVTPPARPAPALRVARLAGSNAEAGGEPRPGRVHGTSSAQQSPNMPSALTSLAPQSAEGPGSESPETGDLRPAPELPLKLAGSRSEFHLWPGTSEPLTGAERNREMGGDPIRTVDTAESVERIAKLVNRETVLFRQHASESMAVVLRPDAHTELLLHLSQRNGQIEANVRCERGDFQQLNAAWSQLQETLSHQKVRLAPLEEAASDAGQHRHPGSPLTSQQDRQFSGQRQPDPDHEFMEEWPAPASSQQTPAQVRTRGGDSERRHSTSRPGWETWA